MNDSIMRWMKGIGAVIVLVVLVLLVGRYWSDYRLAPDDNAPSGETTATVPADGESKEGEGADETEAAAPKPENTKTLQVTIDGLNFRKQPSSGGTAIRGLNTGEKLTLIKEADGWYQVKDSKGVTGYVSANPQYTKVVK